MVTQNNTFLILLINMYFAFPFLLHVSLVIYSDCLTQTQSKLFFPPSSPRYEADKTWIFFIRPRTYPHTHAHIPIEIGGGVVNNFSVPSFDLCISSKVVWAQ